MRRTTEEIDKTLEAIRTVIEMKAEVGDITGLTEKFDKLTQISGTSSFLVGECEEITLEKQGEVMPALLDKKGLTATVIEMYVKGQFPKEYSQLTTAKRLDDKIEKTLDGLRSLISYTRSEMENGLKSYRHQSQQKQ